MLLLTAGMRAQGLPPHRLSLEHCAPTCTGRVAQLIAHHTCNGCNLQPGDLLGTGTISTPGREGCGSLLEITQGGKRRRSRCRPARTRRFLEDGDEVILRARARREGFAPIGFGDCRGTVLPALGGA